MAMKEHSEGGVVVVQLSGGFLGDPEVTDFHNRLRQLKEDGSIKVVADLSRVDLISSAGVGALVGGAKTLREIDGDLKLANLSERTHNVLVVIARLGSVFHIHDTVEEAVAGF
ncbi:MAG: STAS domain-containing protein [Candidatus Latescibacteria bacterium]|jgi:anti-sigma B factor antagonist|nr:STAS domain-containing protein [Candidatus Latescibacterota bacterium]